MAERHQWRQGLIEFKLETVGSQRRYVLYLVPSWFILSEAVLGWHIQQIFSGVQTFLRADHMTRQSGGILYPTWSGNAPGSPLEAQENVTGEKDVLRSPCLACCNSDLDKQQKIDGYV